MLFASWRLGVNINRRNGEMTARYAAVVLLTMVTAALLLAACGPLNRKQPNSPVQPELAALVLTATATPGDALASIHIDAVSDDGRANSRQGPAYPIEVIRRTPYEHVHYYEPGLIITMTADVFIAGDEGEVLGCFFTDNGVVQEQTRQVATILPGRTQAGVRCVYTTKPVPPA
jgi:hypothetical protein